MCQKIDRISLIGEFMRYMRKIQGKYHEWYIYLWEGMNTPHNHGKWEDLVPHDNNP